MFHKNYRISNVVGSSCLNQTICFKKLQNKFLKLVSYEPELFPALVFNLEFGNSIAKIFKNGKIYITGCKDEIDSCIAFEKLLLYLSNC